MPFYRAKGRLSHLKRAPFTMQKGIFYFTKKHLLFSIYESLLQPFLCLVPFHNKRVSLPLHYYNNTIKTTTFQFSCHSYHSSTHHNALITRSLHEMSKVTATKNKNYLNVSSTKSEQCKLCQWVLCKCLYISSLILQQIYRHL